MYAPEQVRAIGEWALEHGIWIVSDEIYQNLTYADDPDGVPARAVSVVDAVPELAEQTILVNGVAKTYAMTGWRLGWMVGPADVIRGAANLQSHLTSNVSNISQRAAIAALTGPHDAVEEMRRAFDRRRRTIVAELSKIDGVTVPVPQGAFYVYPDVSGLLGRTWGGVTPTTSLELADLMLEQAEVAAVPGEAFGPSGYLRFSYALRMQQSGVAPGLHTEGRRNRSADPDGPRISRDTGDARQRSSSRKASFTSSTAFFIPALAWSILPSASRRSLSVTLPAASLVLPLRSSPVFSMRSPTPIIGLLSGGIAAEPQSTSRLACATRG